MTPANLDDYCVGDYPAEFAGIGPVMRVSGTVDRAGTGRQRFGRLLARALVLAMMSACADDVDGSGDDAPRGGATATSQTAAAGRRPDAVAPPTVANTCPDLPANCGTRIPSYADEIDPLLSARCSRCHVPESTAGPMPLDNPERLENASPLILRLLEDCLDAPPHDPELLSEEQRSSLNAWLVCGAPDN